MVDTSLPRLIDRTVSQLRHVWQDIAGSSPGAAAVRTGLPDEDAGALRAKMEECLRGRGGEVSARARAAELGRTYLTLDAEGRERFLRLLARDFASDRAAVDAAIAGVRSAGDEPTRDAAEAALRRALVSPRKKLLTQFNALPEGVKFLVDMRAELLALARRESTLRGLEADLKDLLVSWFDVGFLDLERITWDAPASLLEKLIDYEAVHAITSWSDLKNRLDSDRRCFAFFHPRMPREPLIFVEVALVNGIAGNIQELLDESAPRCAPERADTAIFYSISNAQAGLAGISFGNFLIKRVVDELSKELKGIKTFSTLSPIPGFMEWLRGRLEADDQTLVSAADGRLLEAVSGEESACEALRKLLGGPWATDPAAAPALERPLLRLCARYLLSEKREGRALDPVARFHLTNGARIERINWLGDSSEKGIAQSAGMMVNYLYRLDEIDANHEAYTGEGRIAASSAVRALARDHLSALALGG